MNFIILGDKYQKGMKSKGCVGLLKINNRTNIFDHQYRCIKNCFPDSSIIYVGGFEFKKLQSFISDKYKDVTCINNSDYEIYNNLYSLSLVKDFLINETFIVSGSCIIQPKLLKHFNKTETQVFITGSGDSSLGCIIDNNLITNIGFDLPNTLDEIYYISNSDIQAFKTIVNNIKYRNYFLFEALNLLIDNNISIRPHFHHKTKQNTNVYIK